MLVKQHTYFSATIHVHNPKGVFNISRKFIALTSYFGMVSLPT